MLVFITVCIYICELRSFGHPYHYDPHNHSSGQTEKKIYNTHACIQTCINNDYLINKIISSVFSREEQE